METSSRMPKVKRFGTQRNNRRKMFQEKYCSPKDLVYREFDKLSHPQLRELQRYGTLNVDRRKIAEDICNDKSVIIRATEDSITALVRYSTRYYVAVMDAHLKVIKTFLPANICNFMDYVQKFVDKEKSSSCNSSNAA